jgi:hypothetical protein
MYGGLLIHSFILDLICVATLTACRKQQSTIQASCRRGGVCFCDSDFSEWETSQARLTRPCKGAATPVEGEGEGDVIIFRFSFIVVPHVYSSVVYNHKVQFGLCK